MEQTEEYRNQGWNNNQHKYESIKSDSQTYGFPVLWSISILQHGWCFHGACHWYSWRWGCKQHRGWERHWQNSRGPCCHSGTWTRLYAGDFPMLIRPRGGATGFHHQPGLKGSELALPHETEAGNFHLAPGPESLKWNQQQAAGFQKSPRSINARGQGCKLSSEHKVKGWGAKHRNLTIPVCHCLWRCQCLLFSSWEAGTRLDLVLILTADTSANDGRTWFMQ